MQEISVIWVDRSLQWAKRCRAESQLEFSKQGCYYSWCPRRRETNTSIFIYLKSAFFCPPHSSVFFELVVCWSFWFWSGIPVHKSMRNFMETPAAPLSLQADGRCLPCHLLSSGLYFCAGRAVNFSDTSQDHSVIAQCWLKHPANSVSFRVSLKVLHWNLIKLVLIQMDDFEFIGAHWFFFCGLKKCPSDESQEFSPSLLLQRISLMSLICSKHIWILHFCPDVDKPVMQLLLY